MSRQRQILGSALLVLASTGVCACATGRLASGPATPGMYAAEPATVAELPLVQAAVTSARVTHRDGDVLTVDFTASAVYPNLRLVPATPWNWESDGGTTLVLDVTNPSPVAIPIGLRVDDGAMPDGNFIAASAIVPPGDQRVLLRLASVSPNEPYVAPAKESWTHPGVIVLHPRTGSLFDLSHVTAVTVYLSHPTAATTLTIRRLARVSEAPVLGFAFAAN